MPTSGAPTADVLLSTLKMELQDASADTFEHLCADLFCRLLGDVGVSVSKWARSSAVTLPRTPAGEAPAPAPTRRAREAKVARCLH